jgi:thiol-disulfide isomerase/thioredoxin
MWSLTNLFLADIGRVGHREARGILMRDSSAGAEACRYGGTTAVHVTISRRVLFLVGVTLCVVCAPVSRAQIAAGEAFPDLKAAALSGGDLPDTSGKVVLVDFWASWCAPCKASFPAFARLDQAYRSQGLVIVAVSVDESEQAYAKFVKKWQPPFSALLDREQNLVKAVKVPTMPTSYLLGRDGRVRFVHSGFHGAETEALLREHVEAVLKEKS